MKGLKKYKEDYVDDLAAMNTAIKESVQCYASEVYKRVRIVK
jgi:hypothetical protein